MGRSRKQRIAGYALGVPAAVLLVAFLAYQFAVGSPLAVPLLFGVLGYPLGIGAAYLAVRRLKPRKTLTGKLVLGGVLAAVSVVSIAGSSFVADGLGEDTALGALANGALFGFGLMVFFRLIFSDRFTEGMREG